MGFYVVIVDINSSASATQYADECYQCSLKDIDAVLKIAYIVLPDAVSVGMCEIAV